MFARRILKVAGILGLVAILAVFLNHSDHHPKQPELPESNPVTATTAKPQAQFTSIPALIGPNGQQGQRQLHLAKIGLQLHSQANEKELLADVETIFGSSADIEVIPFGQLKLAKVHLEHACEDLADIEQKTAALLETSPHLAAYPILKMDSGTGWLMYRDEVFVRSFDSIATIRQYFPKDATIQEQWSGARGLHRVALGSRNGFDAIKLCNELQQAQAIDWSEPGMYGSAQPALLPSDTFFHHQWNLRESEPFDINVMNAWDHETGDPSIQVVVLDSGVDLGHPDLNLAPGFDYVNRINGPYGAPRPGGGPVVPEDIHGTPCAGIICARTHFGPWRTDTGVAGIAPGCRVRPARIAHQTGPISWIMNYAHVAEALYHAGDDGVRVSSSSFSIGTHIALLDAAYSDTRDIDNMVHAASTGNSNAGTGAAFPSNLSSVIAVGASHPNGTRIDPSDGASWGSNYGHGLAIMAPGIYIPTTWNGGGYSFNFGGTSAACPHVAAVAALMLSRDSRLLPVQIEAYLHETAKDLGPAGWDNETGFGLLDAAAAVEKAVNGPMHDPWVPLHRYFNGAVTDHLYLVDMGVLGGGKHGWVYEWQEGKVLSRHISGSIPVYRYWNPAGNHFLTNNWYELGWGMLGYQYQKIEFWVFQTQQPGTVPLYRYFNGPAMDHLYTTNWYELGAGSHGYAYEGIVGYILPGNNG